MSVKPSKSVGRKRLLALADYVSSNSRKKSWRQFFDMSQWIGNTKPDGSLIYENYDGGRLLNNGDKVEVNNSCGTSACLLGHGVNVPSIAKAGLRAVFVASGGNCDVRLVLGEDNRNRSMRNVANELFGINGLRTDQMFLYRGPKTHEGYYKHDSMNGVTPGEAVRNLRKVVSQIDANEGWEF